MPRGIPKNKQAQVGRQDSPSGSEAQANGITKWEAVRRALVKLGKKAMPQDIHNFVKEEFKLDIPTSLISNYKHTMLKKKRGKSGLLRKAGQSELLRTAPVPATSENGPSAEAITLEDIEAVKKLADRIGAEKVRDIAGVLGK